MHNPRHQRNIRETLPEHLEAEYLLSRGDRVKDIWLSGLKDRRNFWDGFDKNLDKS